MDCDFSDVRGMDDVEAAVEAAVIRRHNMLFVGPPGIGKTIIARRIPTILPPVTYEQRASLTQLYRKARLLGDDEKFGSARPFRAPHHTISMAAMAGTAKRPCGEFALANHGVLFLDELQEFSTRVIKEIARLQRGPSKVIIVASAILCPCGWHGFVDRKCVCTPDAIARYTDRVESYQCMLKFKAKIQMRFVPFGGLRSSEPGESSADIRARVIAAWSDGCDHRWQRRRDGRRCSLCDKLELGVFA